MLTRMRARSIVYQESWVAAMNPLQVATLYFIHDLPDGIRGFELRYLDRLHRLPWLSNPETCDATIWAALSSAVESHNPKQALVLMVGNVWWRPENDRYWLGQDLRYSITGERETPYVDGDIEDPEVFHEAVNRLRSQMHVAVQQMAFPS